MPWLCTRRLVSWGHLLGKLLQLMPQHFHPSVEVVGAFVGVSNAHSEERIVRGGLGRPPSSLYIGGLCAASASPTVYRHPLQA